MIDLTGMTSLTKDHIREIEMKAKLFSGLSKSMIEEIIDKNKKYMYVDDFPGLRGESQINYVAAKHALSIKKDELTSVLEGSKVTKG